MLGPYVAAEQHNWASCTARRLSVPSLGTHPSQSSSMVATPAVPTKASILAARRIERLPLESYAHAVRERTLRACAAARNAAVASGIASKSRYDSRRHPVSYEVGNLVLLRSLFRQTGLVAMTPLWVSRRQHRPNACPPARICRRQLRA
eukprot:Opistho-1_new@77515